MEKPSPESPKTLFSKPSAGQALPAGKKVNSQQLPDLLLTFPAQSSCTGTQRRSGTNARTFVCNPYAPAPRPSLLSQHRQSPHSRSREISRPWRTIPLFFELAYTGVQNPRFVSKYIRLPRGPSKASTTQLFHLTRTPRSPTLQVVVLARRPYDSDQSLTTTSRLRRNFAAVSQAVHRLLRWERASRRCSGPANRRFDLARTVSG